ncbi:28S ribosomal protein S11, mitochondrial-like isoform X2 [Salmo trutta]|uniref:28S ribosomal protein S11, mitochondrial-like isoform X2 n=1 Tax=Salmo trutta TaxID=8032 RepID=UPI0011323E16|nr:28S ribosomal protein S11, mitochondrial-like isoform X2 [Salmo trutta]
MYKLNGILSHSGRSACQQVAGSFNAGGSICGTSSLQRAVSSSAVRFQEEASVSATPGKISKEFSHLPPMPGQDSVLRWAGKKYEELPIAHIKATYNNTHVQVTDCEGQFMVRISCGTEGFKNVKKSTPIAAQTAGISAAAATAVGVTFVRVLVKGLGPGRLSAIKGLTMGGLEVVSITDNTPVPHNGCRPRKARRI